MNESGVCTVMFFEHGSNKKIFGTDMTCVPIKGQGIQIKKVDYVVNAVKWFFNDNPVPLVHIIIEPSKP